MARLISIEPGCRFILEQDLLFNGNLLVPVGQLVQVTELIGEKGCKIVTVNNGYGRHIVTVGALWRAIHEPKTVAA